MQREYCQPYESTEVGAVPDQGSFAYGASFLSTASIQF